MSERPARSLPRTEERSASQRKYISSDINPKPTTSSASPQSRYVHELREGFAATALGCVASMRASEAVGRYTCVWSCDELAGPEEVSSTTRGGAGLGGAACGEYALTATGRADCC